MANPTALEQNAGGPCGNIDRHLWPDVSEPGAVHESIHVTKEGGIGINVGGYVYVKPLREWHRLAGGTEAFDIRREALSSKTVTNERYALMESLRHGGDWLGHARSFLQSHAVGGDRLIWGSNELVRGLTVQHIEDLALAVAVAAVIEDRKYCDRSPPETSGDEAHALAMEFDRLIDDTLVPNEPLDVYTSNSYRRVGLKRRYCEVLYATRDRADGHPNFSNYALLDALVCAFNAMLARRAVKSNGVDSVPAAVVLPALSEADSSTASAAAGAVHVSQDRFENDNGSDT